VLDQALIEELKNFPNQGILWEIIEQKKPVKQLRWHLKPF
jgi:hypothetical protein